MLYLGLKKRVIVSKNVLTYKFVLYYSRIDKTNKKDDPKYCSRAF